MRFTDCWFLESENVFVSVIMISTYAYEAFLGKCKSWRIWQCVITIDEVINFAFRQPIHIQSEGYGDKQII